MKIGKIVSVEYDKFRVRLFATTKHSTVSINGQVYYFGNIGSYLKANNATGDQILCEVSAILDYNQEGKQFSSFNLDSSREFIVKPIGTITTSGKFAMGVGIFPSLYSDVEIVTFQDLQQILSSQIEEDDDDKIHHSIDIQLLAFCRRSSVKRITMHMAPRLSCLIPMANTQRLLTEN